MTGQEWIEIAKVIAGIITSVALPWITYLGIKMRATTKVYRAKADQKLDTIHALVNGGLLHKLRRIRDLEAAQFARTGDPADYAAFKEAEAAYNEHAARQEALEAAAAKPANADRRNP